MRRTSVASALALFALAAVALAAGPETWRAATQADFLKGELEQVAVDDLGRLTLGPVITTVHDATLKAGKRLCGPFRWQDRPGFTCFQD